MVFDMANSGKFGKYPLDEHFNDAVEEGFDDQGNWTALDGTTVNIDTFYGTEYAKTYGAIDHVKTSK